MHLFCLLRTRGWRMAIAPCPCSRRCCQVGGSVPTLVRSPIYQFLCTPSRGGSVPAMGPKLSTSQGGIRIVRRRFPRRIWLQPLENAQTWCFWLFCLLGTLLTGSELLLVAPLARIDCLVSAIVDFGRISPWSGSALLKSGRLGANPAVGSPVCSAIGVLGAILCAGCDWELCGDTAPYPQRSADDRAVRMTAGLVPAVLCAIPAASASQRIRHVMSMTCR